MEQMHGQQDVLLEIIEILRAHLPSNNSSTHPSYPSRRIPMLQLDQAGELLQGINVQCSQTEESLSAQVRPH
jgi:hypothetical protein